MTPKQRDTPSDQLAIPLRQLQSGSLLVPMSYKELVELGARWIGRDDNAQYRRGQGTNGYVTRMHLRYDATCNGRWRH